MENKNPLSHWLWLLVTVPCLLAILCSFLVAGPACLIAIPILNLVFLFRDAIECDHAGIYMRGWVYAGILCPFAYSLPRCLKTDKNVFPFIVHLALLVTAVVLASI